MAADTADQPPFVVDNHSVATRRWSLDIPLLEPSGLTQTYGLGWGLTAGIWARAYQQWARAVASSLHLVLPPGPAQCYFNWSHVKQMASTSHDTAVRRVAVDRKTVLTRARPGVWATFARPGGGAHMCPPPANSKTTQRIDKRKKALDKS